MVRGIIFDWGRTLWDNESKALFSDSISTLEYLKRKGYRVAVLSKSDPEKFEQKFETIAKSGIQHYFDKIIVSTKKEKEEIDEIKNEWGLEYGEILIVGDRVVREVVIANKLGMKSVWLKRGKFAQELPNKETSEPNYIIFSVHELLDIL